MTSYLCILRGINVGGHKKIKMAELRSQLGSLGLENLRTYIQSGNLVFEGPEGQASTFAQQIQDSIREHYGFEVPTLVIPAEEWEQVLNHNPFLPDRTDDFTKLLVTFLAEEPSPESWEALQEKPFPPDEVVLQGKALYLFCPNGYGRTKYSNPLIERKLKVTATTRNWKTVRKLAEMAGLEVVEGD